MMSWRRRRVHTRRGFSCEYASARHPELGRRADVRARGSGDLVIAGHRFGLVDKLSQRGRELAGLLDRDWFVGVELVHHDVAGDAAVVMLRAVDPDFDVLAVAGTVDDPR
jgi:hypothetical protein